MNITLSPISAIGLAARYLGIVVVLTLAALTVASAATHSLTLYGAQHPQMLKACCGASRPRPGLRWA